MPGTALKVQRKPDYAGNGLGSPGLFNLLLVWLKFGHFCKFGSSLATSRNRADIGIPITNWLINENQALTSFSTRKYPRKV